jgi:V/A-type H+/Na+-transporting ATPase subunit D
MAGIRGMPPGRAGRVWLQHRWEVADRGATLLETKMRILAGEQQRFVLLAERTERRWAEAVADAERWMLRADVLSGRRGLRLATEYQPAQVTIRWETTMGVTYPNRAHVRLPDPAPDAPTPDNTALVHAREAYRTALVAAAEHAAATAAREAVEKEMAATRQRLRAIKDRWVPRLEAAGRALTEALEEQEREEGMRLRWAAARLGREHG